MQAVREKVNIDVGQDRREPRWSVAALGLPLPFVGVLLLQTVIGVLWLDARLGKIDTVIEQQKEMKQQIYQQNDAARDLALRDDRIRQLTRRVDLIECYQDGRKRCAIE
jgi:hypothetical protein